MRVDSERSTNHMHFHDGTTCHGSPTMRECLDQAVKRGWIGKVLEQTDTNGRGETVKCYSLIAGSFEHHGKRGTYVAETKIVGLHMTVESLRVDSKDTEAMSNERSYLAFKALHAVYHEHDFRVRVNDPTINFVRRILVTCIGHDTMPEKARRKAEERSQCPACAAGFNHLDEQPSAKDR